MDIEKALPTPEAQAARRMLLGLTEEDLAREVLVTAETIARFESGEDVGEDVARTIEQTLTRLEQGTLEL
jgi:predicted transcriptional regulator